ncbi:MULTISPECIES: hypothetical protein [Streptomyces]|uniref:Uncharacterized protein n=1 Tax=Streptomyces pratisoli TaxID=3139917 RepID=A0ACC6QQQ2_9ACTN|nr:hypothetical protein [Streptomyces sp. NBC_00259]
MRAESSSAARTGAFTAVTVEEAGAAALWVLRACPRAASGEGGP